MNNQYEKLPILRGIPKGYSWGYCRDVSPPLHIETVDYRHRGQHKIFLEREGKRVFEPVGKIPKAILGPVRKVVEKYRREIEGAWVTTLLQRGMIHVVRKLPLIEIVVYPGHEQEFRVKQDLSKELIPETLAELRPEDIVLQENLCSLQLFPEWDESQRFDYWLPGLIWGRLRGYHTEVHMPGWEFDAPSNVTEDEDGQAGEATPSKR